MGLRRPERARARQGIDSEAIWVNRGLWRTFKFSRISRIARDLTRHRGAILCKNREETLSNSESPGGHKVWARHRAGRARAGFGGI